MRMDGVAEFGGSRFQRLAQRDLRDQIGRAMADNLASENLSVLLARDQLDEAFDVIGRDRLAHRPERNLADFDFDAAGASLGLAQPDRRDLGLAIDAGRDAREVEARLATPAMISTAAMPSAEALCASMGSRATSPIA